MTIKIKWGLFIILVVMGLYSAFAMTLTLLTKNVYVGASMIMILAIALSININDYEKELYEEYNKATI
jgi:hypothetical protein